MNTYLIVSETIYHVKNKLKEITNGVEDIVNFNMEENSMSEILQEASYYGMFDNNKCVVVKNAKIFGSSKNSDTNKFKEDSNKLIKYLENENKNTKLIFIFNGKCDSKKKIYNIIKDAGNLFLYPKLTKTEIKNELYKIIIDRKYKISDKSLWHIINSTLGNFDLCVNELEKIMLYYNKPCEIVYEDVIKLTSRIIEDNNFKLVDSIISKDLNTSLKLLNDLKTLKVEPSIIIALLYREFRLMLSILMYEKNKYNYKEILEELNIADWQYNKIKNNLRIFNEREIKEEIVKLSVLDYKFKSGLIDKDTILINYIFDLCE